MLFDSHTHINNENYTNQERQALIQELGSAPALSYVCDIGFDIPSSEQALRDAADAPWCYAAVGVHPHDAKTLDEAGLARIRQLSREPKAVAIGEIGLDYHYDFSPRDAQRTWFRRQIQLAIEEKLPMVIHSREADQETLDILTEEGAFSQARTACFAPRQAPAGGQAGSAADARVVIHCFSGSAELAKQYVNLGATIGICGPVTFKNNKKTVRVVEAVPLDYLLIETDAPYLTPEPYRGRPNKASYVEYVARRIGEIKGISYEEVADATCQNACRFYGI